MRVAIIGANGQLGSDLVTEFASNGDEIFPLTHSDIELASRESVEYCLLRQEPEVVVNASAMHNVEQCEGDQKEHSR